MTQAVLKLEMGLRSSDIRELERLVEGLSKKGINIDTRSYRDLQEMRGMFITVVRFSPYENGVGIREDIVCTTILDELRTFGNHENVLSYTLRRNDEAAGCYAKIV